ncbi:MAG: ABC transporter permease [Trueperaceae bacterium]|nr:MAG: ABC transporter permease [Trueperaceae bacterium]
MTTYVIRRLLDLAFVLFGVSVLIFMMLRLIPGDAVAIMLGANIDITPERIEALRRQLGLHLPLHQQYAQWLGGVLQGDFGRSVWTGRPVADEIVGRLPVTLQLSFMALAFAIVVSFPLGMLAAGARGGRADAVVRLASIVGLTLPSFWVGVLLLYVTSMYLPAWPTIGYVPFVEDPVGNLARMALPTFAVALPMIAALTRILRSSLLDVLSLDYIRTGKAKGLATRTLFYKHALRNAMIPVITVIGVQVGYLLSGVVVIEQVFAIPGLGRLVIGAINERNYPLAQGVILVATVVFVFVNLVVDLAYAWIDPRVEYT